MSHESEYSDKGANALHDVQIEHQHPAVNHVAPSAAPEGERELEGHGANGGEGGEGGTALESSQEGGQGDEQKAGGKSSQITTHKPIKYIACLPALVPSCGLLPSEPTIGRPRQRFHDTDHRPALHLTTDASQSEPPLPDAPSALSNSANPDKKKKRKKKKKKKSQDTLSPSTPTEGNEHVTTTTAAATPTTAYPTELLPSPKEETGAPDLLSTSLSEEATSPTATASKPKKKKRPKKKKKKAVVADEEVADTPTTATQGAGLNMEQPDHNEQQGADAHPEAPAPATEPSPDVPAHLDAIEHDHDAPTAPHDADTGENPQQRRCCCRGS